MSDLIPEGWNEYRQGDIADFSNGKAYKLTEWETSGTPVIRLQNLTGSGKNYYYSNLKLPERQYCESGDLLYMWSATFGPHIWKGQRAIYHYHIWKITCNETELTKEFLYQLLGYKTSEWLNQSNGMGILHITKGSMEDLRLTIPPLLEQQKIAAILTSVDEVIEKTQAQIDKLKDLKSGMMQELLTKGVGVDGKPHTEFKDSPVGRIPKMWKMAPLSNVCELQVGYAFKSTWFVDAGIKLLRGDNVGFGTATWERTKYLSKHEANNYQDYQLSRGDIIIGMDRTFTKSGVKITKLSIEDTPSLLVQRVGRFLPKSTCDDDFLWQLLRSSQYLDALKGQEKGMDIPHLSKSEILTPYVVIPPLEEQKIIARTLRSVDDMIERNSKKLISNNLLKKALMQDLLTGKVRVTID